MRRIAMIVLLLLSFAGLACHRTAAQPANTATDDTMSTGPSTNTATSAPTPTDTTYTNATTGSSATTGTPVSATGT